MQDFTKNMILRPIEQLVMLKLINRYNILFKLKFILGVVVITIPLYLNASTKLQSDFYPFRIKGVVYSAKDTLLYLDYKDAHVKGKLKLAHLFDRYPTYVYDCRVDGIIRQEQNDINPETELYQPDYGWYKWLNKLSDKYEEYESLGKMHTDQIECITLELPEDYKPNVLGLVNYPGKYPQFF